MSLRRLVLWRHGETDHNADGRLQGHVDSVLTEHGWEQARRAVPALARFRPALVLASDLRRAIDTATVFTEATGVGLRLDKRLRETNMGSWQGKTMAELDDTAKHEWYIDPGWAPPGGETKLEVAARACELVSELDDEFSDHEVDDTVLLTAHGGLINALAGALLALPPEYWLRLGGVGNCHWTVLRRRADRWRLVVYNAGVTE